MIINNLDYLNEEELSLLANIMARHFPTSSNLFDKTGLKSCRAKFVLSAITGSLNQINDEGKPVYKSLCQKVGLEGWAETNVKLN